MIAATTAPLVDCPPAGLSPRLERLRGRALRRGNRTLGRPGERARAMMTAWQAAPDVSWVQHRALTLRELARSATLAIGPDERLAGEHLFCSESVGLDFGQWDDAARKALASAALPAADKAALAEFLPRYAAWRAAPLSRVGRKEEGSETGKGSWGRGDVFWASGWIENHSIRDFAKVIRIGFGGIRQEVLRRLESLPRWDPAFPEAANFWHAALAVCDAGIALGRRHAELARRLAREAADPDERGRLESIAAVCARVPEYGARSLREAVQALWFAHVLTCAEDSINANSIGRLDQILQPYYQADLDAGALAPDDALELMEDLACKLYLDYDVQQICLGGQTPDGRDAANAMTCLILEATRRLGFIRCISVRLHARSPEPLVRAAAELVCEGGGIPFFFNDEAVIRALTDRGIALEDARDYAPIGCVEITIPGRANPHAVSGWLNAAKCLELALFDGVDPSTGQRFGPSTGPFASHESFESLLAAFRQQLDDFTQRMVYWCNRGELAQAERGPLPCWSTLTDHCIERGRDITDGGAKYVYHSIAFLGVPDAADALAAIRRLIYEERQVLPVDLLAALKADFKGYEALRGMLLSRAEKYGNDADGVDRLAADICRHFIETMDGFRSPLGGRYFVHLFSFVCNLTFGLSTGALPDGRRAGEPLAYSLSPHQGRDQEGVTAMMKSLAKIPHHLAAGSSAAIIELDPALVRGAAGVDRMASLIRTGVAMGIGQMQFNVVTAEALEKALADPERYGNIQVRVAGYSSKFRLLNRPLQEHIIARTKHRQ